MKLNSVYLFGEISIKGYANVPPVTFHGLRHTFASNFMMSGGSIYDLQKMLGHSTIQMTEKYSHLSPDHLAGKTEILEFDVQNSKTDLISFDRCFGTLTKS